MSGYGGTGTLTPTIVGILISFNFLLAIVYGNDWLASNCSFTIKSVSNINIYSPIRKLIVSTNQSLNTFQIPKAVLLKMRLWDRCFPVNFTKFLRTPFLPEHLLWLLLKYFVYQFLGRPKKANMYMIWDEMEETTFANKD